MGGDGRGDMITLGLNASPIIDGNCDILVKNVLAGASLNGSQAIHYDLNEFDIIPCQSCGVSPYPAYCFFQDAMTEIYRILIEADLVVFGSPIYFDTVSAQAKLFIDRCNCLKPAIFPESEEKLSDRVKFGDLGLKRRKGVIVLAGGERQKFDCASTVVKGFFKWIGIEFVEQIEARNNSLKKGTVNQQPGLLKSAFDLGAGLAEMIQRNGIK
ncbi:MAG: hypothetical protein GF315_00865 [candidate division Zixibacteria bacterium]|nr:hypothetical protein [candidate division Zixibacteria bacterium]